MKNLFRGFSIKVWKGADFDGNKCTTFNRTSNKHCMNYYWKHWKDVNEKLHDETVQSKRVIEWK